jgi:Tol biopolymer transport system component
MLRPSRVSASLSLLGLVGVVAATVPYFAEPVRLLRNPAISNSGTLAFTFQDDIWIANADGSGARRLTNHLARDENPLFSPDGRTVAFTSNRSGNGDVWLVPVTGGEPKQLTFFTGNDEAVSWTPDGQALVLVTGRGTHPFGNPLYRAPIDGSIPTPLPVDFGSTGMIKQDGSILAFNRGSAPPTTRRGYKGNNNADVYVLDLKTNAIRQLTDTNPKDFRTHVHDGHPMWAADGQIYYVSERGGNFNIWRMDATGRNQRQVTSHKDDVQNPSISSDGKRIVYENDFGLMTLDVATGRSRAVPVVIDTDLKDNVVSYLTTESRADGFGPHPNGDYVAVDFHGDIMVVPAEAEIAMARTVPAVFPRRDQARLHLRRESRGGALDPRLHDRHQEEDHDACVDEAGLCVVEQFGQDRRRRRQQDLRRRRRDGPGHRDRPQHRRRLHDQRLFQRQQLAGLRPVGRIPEPRGLSLRPANEERDQRHPEPAVRWKRDPDSGWQARRLHVSA